MDSLLAMLTRPPFDRPTTASCGASSRHDVNDIDNCSVIVCVLGSRKEGMQEEQEQEAEEGIINAPFNPLSIFRNFTVSGIQNKFHEDLMFEEEELSEAGLPELGYRSSSSNGFYPPMSSVMKVSPLSEEETSEWLRAAGLRDDDIPRIKLSIEYQHKRSKDLAVEISSIDRPRKGKRTVLGRISNFVSSSLRLRNRRESKREKKERDPKVKLKELVGAQATTYDEIQRLESLHAPIRRLPIEVLEEIFRQCVPRQRFIKPSIREAPMLLTQVCRAWRDVCLSSPYLWSSLDLSSSEHRAKPTRRRDSKTKLALLDLWTSRSRGCPLSLHIDADEDIFDVSQLSARWHSLKIYAPFDNCLLFSDPNCVYPYLQSFEIDTPNFIEYPLARDIVSVLSQAPNLRNFVWDNHGRHSITPFDMRTNNLTRLTLNAAIPVDQCLSIMSSSPKLTHLSFQHIVMSKCTRPPGSQNILLPDLVSLVLSADYNIHYIVEEITAPKLRQLVLHVKSWPHSNIVNFLKRSRSPMESLNIFFPPITDTELLETLQCVQGTLKEFTLQGSEVPEMASVTDRVLDRLTVRDDADADEVLCPNAMVMAFYGCISCSPGKFANMVRSRLVSNLSPSNRSPSSRLPILPLSVLEMYDFEVLSLDVEPLRSEGLILKLYTRDGVPLEMQWEEAERLRKLREDGLVLRVYSSETGWFGELDGDWE